MVGAIAEPRLAYTKQQQWLFLSILFLVTTSNYFDYFILSALLEPIKHEFGVSDTMLGLLSGLVFAFVYAVAGLPISRWADRGNRPLIITLALAGWSVMTMLCGLAQSFWQLMAARFGLGVAEPGAMPPAQSLIADYFPPDRRAVAITVLVQGGSAAGWLLGIGVGAWIAAAWGWRAAFLIAGASGLILAVLVRIGLPEPRTRLRPQGVPQAVRESIRASLKVLARKRTFVLTLTAYTIYGIFIFGLLVFLPSFVVRSFHIPLESISLEWGAAVAVSNLTGAFVGGWLADRLSGKDARWYVWLPALGCALGGPLYAVTLFADDVGTFISLNFIAEFVLSVGVPVCYAAFHAVCGNRRRAFAVALIYFFFTLIGTGGGPVVVGALSDLFTARFGDEGLRYALIAATCLALPAALVFCMAGRFIRADQEEWRPVHPVAGA